MRPNVWQLRDADILAAIPELPSATERTSACSANGSDTIEITYEPLVVTEGVALPRVVVCRGLPPAPEASCELQKSAYRYFEKDPARYLEVGHGLALPEAFEVIRQIEAGSYSPRGALEQLVGRSPATSIRAVANHHYILSWHDCACAVEVLFKRGQVPDAPLEIVDQSASCV